MKKNIKVETTELDFNDKTRQDERLGIMNRSMISSIGTIIKEGGNLDFIMDIKEMIDTLSTTFWSLICLRSSSPLHDNKSNELIVVMEKQIEKNFAELKHVAFELNEVREEREKDKNNAH